MDAVLQNLIELGRDLAVLALSIGRVLLPLVPLVAWVAFWTLAVNWTRLRSVLLQGGWVGLVLLGFLAVLVWGTVAPPVGGAHQFFELTLGNFVGKTVLVTALICIMLLCGSVQLSGACGSLCQFDEPGEDEGHHHASHGDSHDAGHTAPAAAHH
ncbi:MAG TPA: hypothetical protein VEI07_13690 [Planctomycetaceae bacterium]|nr:hypothetical protein [Planctomycetaceae bacterium]